MPGTVLVIHTDGAARGNPGPAGAGWVVETMEGELVAEGCAYLGELTNNQAEYEALLLALDAVDPQSLWRTASRPASR